MAKKMTEQEIKDWNELYEYVKLDILGYKDKKLPNTLVLRLKGLNEGKFMANKYTKPMANYSFKQILTTFKICKFDINNGFRANEKVFKNEGHKINYMMVIIEKKINDVVDKMINVEKSKLKGEKVEVNANDEKAEYKIKTKEVKNSILNDLW